MCGCVVPVIFFGGLYLVFSGIFAGDALSCAAGIFLCVVAFAAASVASGMED